MKFYDLHVHTNLSACADRDAYIDGHVQAAERFGVKVIGFSDHAWDAAVEGASPWYKPQNYERLFERNALPNENVRVFYGAEGEFANFKLAVKRETIEKLDYIIVPHSHVHLRGLVLPEEYAPHDKLAEFLVKSFTALCNHEDSDLIFGVAHPFYPLGKGGADFDEVLSYISREDLLGCFKAANDNNIRVELNLNCFVNVPPSEVDGYSYTRIMRTAGEAGCKFFLGSDSHRHYTESHPFFKAEEYIKSIGLDEKDFEIDFDNFSLRERKNG